MGRAQGMRNAAAAVAGATRASRGADEQQQFDRLMQLASERAYFGDDPEMLSLQRSLAERLAVERAPAARRMFSEAHSAMFGAAPAAPLADRALSRALESHVHVYAVTGAMFDEPSVQRLHAGAEAPARLAVARQLAEIARSEQGAQLRQRLFEESGEELPELLDPERLPWEEGLERWLAHEDRSLTELSARLESALMDEWAEMAAESRAEDRRYGW